MSYNYTTVIATIPNGWNDDGSGYALTSHGEDTLIHLISKRLPDAVSWCGDELIAACDSKRNPDPSIPGDFDIDEIVHEAWSELYSMDDSDIWEAD